MEKEGLGKITKQARGTSGVGQEWIEKNQDLWMHVSLAVASAVPTFSAQLQKVPEKIRKFGLFSVLYYNATNISKFHRDLKVQGR